MKTGRLIPWLSVLLCAALALPASGEYKYWVPSTGYWFTPGNWDSYGVPTSADNAYIDNGGTATIPSHFAVGAEYTCVGYENMGTVIQTGGTHTVGEVLYMGYSSGTSGVYNLQGGELTVGDVACIGFGGTASFTQSGGTHTAEYLSIGAQGRYELSGGVLNVEDGLCVHPAGGVFDFAGGSAEVYASGIVDFAGGDLLNAGAASLSVGANSLTVFPAGSDPQSVFGSFSTLGMTHVGGGTLTVSAGEGFAGRGTLTDFVDCQGTVGDAASRIDLLGGVFVSAPGQVELGDGDLYVEAPGSGISGGSLSTYRSHIAYEGTGSFTQTGGTHRAGGLSLGERIGSEGTYALQDGELAVGDGWEDEYLGREGTGSFTQTGGTHSVGRGLHLGYDEGSTGVYDLEAGELVTGWEKVGYYGTGGFTQSGGTHSVGGLNLGYLEGSEGVYDLYDGELSVAGEAHVGGEGIGSFTQSGGTHSVGDLNLGYLEGSTGVYDLQDGGLTVANDAYVGRSGTGSFTQSGGTHSVGGLNVGSNSDSTGVYDLQNGEVSTDGTYVGYGGTGSFTQTGGTHSVGNDFYLGRSYSSTGVYHLEAGQLTVGGWEYVGRYGGTGTFFQTGGTHKVGDRLYLGHVLDSTGVYELQDGVLVVTGSEYIAQHENTGRFTQAGGTHQVGYLSIDGGGRYELSGGILAVTPDGLKIIPGGVLDFAGGSAEVYASGIVDFSEGDLLNAGAASLSVGANSLTVFPAGSDPQSVFGSFSTLGMTHVGGGTLTVSAGEGFAGRGTLTDFVDCQGTVGDAASRIDLLGGVFVSAPGQVELGDGDLYVEAPGSGISGGSLSTYRSYVGYAASGSFIQTGGTHSVDGSLRLGYELGSTGIYGLHDGELAVNGSAYLGYDGMGSFTQAGGTHSMGNDLVLGYYEGSTGVYDLQNGQLTIEDMVCIGWQLSWFSPGTGSFTQSGGTHTAGYVGVGNTGRYELSGGVLDIAQDGLGIEPGGVLDLVGGSAEVYASGIVDFTRGDLLNAGSASLVGRPNSLIIFPTGSDPQSVFGSFTTQGMAHVAGTTLTVSAGEGFRGRGQLSDFVDCQGTVGDTESRISLLGGVFVSGAGQVELGEDYGELYVEAPGSGISGGSLSTLSTYVGYEGTGSFTQTGGTHSLGYSLYLGKEAGATGIYDLHNGVLAVNGRAYLGRDGTGSFTQTGGMHSVADDLSLGDDEGSTGTYDLQGGVLIASTIKAGSGTWAFNFTGGTLHAGTVEFDLVNDGGILAPGQSIGATAITGGYTQNAGELQIELAGLAEFDTLDVSGSAALGGSLNVLGLASYRPKEGDSFPIITASSGFAGDFSESISSITAGIPDGLSAFSGSAGASVYEVIFNGLTAGDANGDHRASLGDLSIMAGNWNQSGKMWAEGDFNGDGKLSIGDLSMLAGNWNWELPAGAAVPEPATLSLLALGGLALVRRRRK